MRNLWMSSSTDCKVGGNTPSRLMKRHDLNLVCGGKFEIFAPSLSSKDQTWSFSQTNLPLRPIWPAWKIFEKWSSISNNQVMKTLSSFFIQWMRRALCNSYLRFVFTRIGTVSLPVLVNGNVTEALPVYFLIQQHCWQTQIQSNSKQWKVEIRKLKSTLRSQQTLLVGWARKATLISAEKRRTFAQLLKNWERALPAIRAPLSVAKSPPSQWAEKPSYLLLSSLMAANLKLQTPFRTCNVTQIIDST